MSRLAARKCVRHSAREAIARCPACTEHFSRECIVEHAGVLLCASCLAKETAAKTTAPVERRWVGVVGRWTATAMSALLLWIVLYGLGQFLKTIPPELHEGTIWRIGEPHN